MTEETRKLLQVIQQLTEELHPDVSTGAVEPDSSLDRDLGLDSLARMELLARLEKAFDIRLSEQVMATVETPRDLMRQLDSREKKYPRQSWQPAAPLVSPAATCQPPHAASTLVEVLQYHVLSQPEQVHILLDEFQDDPVLITYGDLHKGALRVAAGLQQADLEPGETVALVLPTGSEYFFSFFGILMAGGIPVPLYPPVRPTQIEEHLRRHRGILQNAGVKILVTVPEVRKIAGLLKLQVDTLELVTTVSELAGQEKDYVPIPVQEGDVAFLQYTSGSTGDPKGVVLTHANLLANIRAMGEVTGVTMRDVFVSWLPLYHDMGLIGAWFGSLYFGCRLVIMPPLSFIARPERWLWAIHKHRGTMSASPNFGYELCERRISDKDIEGLDLSSWRLAFNGAEPVTVAAITNFCRRFAGYGLNKEAMTPVYGLAESSVGLAFPPLGRGPLIDRIERETFVRSGHAVPVLDDNTAALEFVACGQPLPGHQIRIVDRSGRELPDRHEGSLQFKGPSATSGYFRSPEKTGSLFQNEWLDSGDLAYIAEGDVYVTGRIKDIIIRGGRNVYPHELEEAVGNIPGIRKGCVAVFGTLAPVSYQRPAVKCVKHRVYSDSLKKHSQHTDGMPASVSLRESLYPQHLPTFRDDLGEKCGLDRHSGTEKLVVLAESRKRDPRDRAALHKQIMDIGVDLLNMPPDDIVIAPPGTVLKTSSGKIRRAASRVLYEEDRIGKPGRAVWLQVVRLALAGVIPQVRRAWYQVIDTLYACYCWVLFSLLCIPLWLLVVVLPGKRVRWHVTRYTAKLLVVMSGTRLRVQGLENIPSDQPVVIVANHMSYLDAYLLQAVLPVPCSFIAKAELADSLPVRVVLSRLGAFLVERFDMERGMEDAKNIAKMASEGQVFLFFPEATFQRIPGLLPFRMGAFLTSAQAGIPVVPVTIRGTRNKLRSGSWFPRRGAISVFIGSPVLPDGEDWAAALRLRDAVRQEILKHLGEPDLAGSFATLSGMNNSDTDRQKSP